MHILTVKLTVKCVIYCLFTANLQLNAVKTRHSNLENFEAKTGQNCVLANLPPKSCPNKINRFTVKFL